MTYHILRFFMDEPHSTKEIRSGLTMDEALAHCSDPETNSSTCRGSVGRERTKRRGPWLDGWTVSR